MNNKTNREKIDAHRARLAESGTALDYAERLNARASLILSGACDVSEWETVATLYTSIALRYERACDEDNAERYFKFARYYLLLVAELG